jgi:excisionase family DNA binding protein
MGRRLLIVAEVASALRVSARTVRQWIACGRVAALRVGRRHLVEPLEVDRLLEEARRHGLVISSPARVQPSAAAETNGVAKRPLSVPPPA